MLVLCGTSGKVSDRVKVREKHPVQALKLNWERESAGTGDMGGQTHKHDLACMTASDSQAAGSQPDLSQICQIQSDRLR